MKHIKTYKIFESLLPKESVNETLSPDEISDIKDICLELEDKGYSIQFNTTPTTNGYYIVMIEKITEYPYNDGFVYNDVEEVVDRLQDYIGMKIMEISVLVDPKKETGYVQVIKWIDLIDYKIDQKKHYSSQIRYEKLIKCVSIRLN
jgi:hypothetical protein